MSIPTTPQAPTEERLLTTADLEEQPKGKEGKLEGYELWRSMGEPKYVVAPMVDQSELVRRFFQAWRWYGGESESTKRIRE
jgi:hypothetical protein